ncbi:hypothetical protein [Pseudomonas phage Eisa9]|uniref:Uncharacterized protein n=1 Tax=Pseudomonas phage Eisa9 TaxID=2900148 RepID=A0AAE8YJ09_9CAUD|nr:hypothetical protein [Pseudomonas phage Eisa9]
MNKKRNWMILIFNDGYLSGRLGELLNCPKEVAADILRTKRNQLSEQDKAWVTYKLVEVHDVS